MVPTRQRRTSRGTNAWFDSRSCPLSQSPGTACQRSGDLGDGQVSQPEQRRWRSFPGKFDTSPRKHQEVPCFLGFSCISAKARHGNENTGKTAENRRPRVSLTPGRSPATEQAGLIGIPLRLEVLTNSAASLWSTSGARRFSVPVVGRMNTRKCLSANALAAHERRTWACFAHNCWPGLVHYDPLIFPSSSRSPCTICSPAGASPKIISRMRE